MSDKPMKGMHLHALSGGFAVGDSVIDITAEQNGWADMRGKVIDVVGSHVLVCYASGTDRWKMHINLRNA